MCAKKAVPAKGTPVKKTAAKKTTAESKAPVKKSASALAADNSRGWKVHCAKHGVIGKNMTEAEANALAASHHAQTGHRTMAEGTQVTVSLKQIVFSGKIPGEIVTA